MVGSQGDADSCVFAVEHTDTDETADEALSSTSACDLSCRESRANFTSYAEFDEARFILAVAFFVAAV